MPFSEGEAVLIAEIERDKIVRGKYALDAVSHRPTHLASIPQISRATNSSSNYADPRSVLPNWRPRTAPVSGRRYSMVSRADSVQLGLLGRQTEARLKAG